ncbi:hypothetical protein ACFFP0_15580 [Rhizobium puerariae]|uniref:Glycosyltransferase n=1 Tax=Rhizobium puerariae TaxID=1585791 RepID=A0ABV6AI32_9HYPH
MLFSSTEDGHRGAYLSFVASVLPSRRASLREVFLSASPVFFLMIEDSFFIFVLAAFFRALLGRRTAGILMRPKPALEGGGLRLRVKRLLLRTMRPIGSIRVLTILPFSIHPEFGRIADDWIYDFQLWDLTDEERERTLRRGGEGLGKSIRDAASGRRVISAVGRQDKRKGFDVLARAAAELTALAGQLHFVSVGSVHGEVKLAAAELSSAGGMVVDRYISDQELCECYGASDVIWALYAPYDDQASGIAGRAAQLGIPCIVRTGSLSHRLCLSEGVPHIDATEDTLDRLARPVPPRDDAAGRAMAARFREVSVARLERIFDLKRPEGRSDDPPSP